MTDYIDLLGNALSEAAAQEYAPKPSTWRTHLRHRSRPGREALMIVSGLAASLAVTVAIALVLLIGGAGAPPAYAITTHPDGSVTVTVHSIQFAAKPLDARLAALGIPTRILPIRKRCSYQGPVSLIKPSQLRLPWTFTVKSSHRWLQPGDWGFIALGPARSDGRVAYLQGAMKPPLPPCFSTVYYNGFRHIDH